MTPQSTLMVVAPIEARREAELRHLLARMNGEVGVADPGNPLLPFSQFPTLHFARFVILDDATAEDLRAYGADPLPPTKSLAFLCDCDGPAGSTPRGTGKARWGWTTKDFLLLPGVPC